MSNYPSEAPLFQQRGLLLVVPVFRKKQPATAKGDVEAGGQGEAGERAEEAGYDSTLHGHGHPGRCRGPKQRSGMDTRQRPTGAPSHSRSPCWRSHSRPVCVARSRPLHPKPQPTTRTTPPPPHEKGHGTDAATHTDTGKRGDKGFDPRTGTRLLGPLRAERAGETEDRGHVSDRWVGNPR